MSITEYHLRVQSTASDADASTVTLHVDLRRRIDDWTAMRLDPLPDVPRHTVELARAHTKTAGAARTCPEDLLEPGPLTQEFATLTAWLWDTALSEPMRNLLRADAGHLRIVLTATGDAALLPWETLLDHPALAARTAAAPIELVRQLPPATAATTGTNAVDPDRIPQIRSPVPRRALVLIGHTLQDQNVHDPNDEIHSVVEAMKAAGFEVVTVCGHPAIRDHQLPTPAGSIHIDEQLTAPIKATEDERRVFVRAVLERIFRERCPAIVHTFGHSDASTAANGDPRGGSSLYLDVDEIPIELTIADFARLLRLGHTRIAILAACNLRERAAEALLDAGGAEHVVTMSAFVAPSDARAWAETFYRELSHAEGTSRSIHRAAAAARRAFPEPLRWMPWHNAIPEAAVAIAGPIEQRIARYCEKLAGRLRELEGRFRGTGWVFQSRPADVYVELGIAGREQARTPLDLRDDPRRFDGEPTFAQLLELHTRRFLLGGNAGAGKSTTLRMHARQLAADGANGLRQLVPVFMPLTAWLQPTGAARDGESVTPRKLLDVAVESLLGQDTSSAEQAATVEALTALAAAGRLVILLDGLDELGRAERSALRSVLSTAFHACKIVVSTRRYQHTGSLDGFYDVDLKPLTAARAQELFRGLLANHASGSPSNRNRQQRIDDWCDRFERGPRIWQELGEVPLFVTLIAELVAAGKEPGDTKAKFFDDVLMHLCLTQHRGETEVDPARHEVGATPMVAPDPTLRVGSASYNLDLLTRVRSVLDILGEIALRMTQATTIDATRAKLLEWLAEAGERAAAPLGQLDLKAEQFLDQVHLRTSILAPDLNIDHPSGTYVEARWRFWHRSFQEALTAMKLETSISGADLEQSLQHLALAPSEAVRRDCFAGLQAQWISDAESIWEDLRDAPSQATLADFALVADCFDPATGMWDMQILMDRCAAVLTPVRAHQRATDFWIEPYKLFLERIDAFVDKAGLKNFSVKALEFNRDFGRQLITALPRTSVALLCEAFKATDSWETDLQSLNGSSGRHDLWRALSLRLRERAQIYIAASRQLDQDCMAELLLRRVQSTRAERFGDPGELGLVSLLALGLHEARNRKRVDQEIDSVLVEGRPSCALWADHFAWIPGGVFSQGSLNGEAQERPVHEVELEDFYMGRSHVTIRQFAEFWPNHMVDIATDVRTVAEWAEVNIEGEPCADLPVTHISWYAAVLLCRWMRLHSYCLPSEIRRLSPTLPSEAQAERAIRGGSESEYWFGTPDAAPHHAWFSPNSGDRPHRVDSKPRNALGLADVVGNAWWWCRDAFRRDTYKSRPSRISRDPIVAGPICASRVVRGGAFAFTGMNLLRSANRDGNKPYAADYFQGVRVALVAERPEERSFLNIGRTE